MGKGTLIPIFSLEGYALPKIYLNPLYHPFSELICKGNIKKWYTQSIKYEYYSKNINL